MQEPAPLFAEHLRQALAYGRSRGIARPSTAVALIIGALLAFGWLVSVAAWLVLLALYLVAVALRGVLATLQFRSLGVGALTVTALPLTHAAYLAGALAGMVGREAKAQCCDARTQRGRLDPEHRC